MGRKPKSTAAKAAIKVTKTEKRQAARQEAGAMRVWAADQVGTAEDSESDVDSEETRTQLQLEVKASALALAKQAKVMFARSEEMKKQNGLAVEEKWNLMEVEGYWFPGAASSSSSSSSTATAPLREDTVGAGESNDVVRQERLAALMTSAHDVVTILPTPPFEVLEEVGEACVPPFQTIQAVPKPNLAKEARAAEHAIFVTRFHEGLAKERRERKKEE